MSKKNGDRSNLKLDDYRNRKSNQASESGGKHGPVNKRERLKKDMRWSKLVDLILNFMSIIITLYAVALAMVREIAWPFIVIAAVVCPLWVILAKRLFWQDKQVLAWVVRGAIVLGGYVLLSVSVRYCRYNRCIPVVAEENFRNYFTEQNEEKKLEYVRMDGLSQNIMGDFTELTAVIVYKDSSSTENTTEMKLYFDRLNGRYYESEEKLKAYREQIRQLGVKSDGVTGSSVTGSSAMPAGSGVTGSGVTPAGSDMASSSVTPAAGS